MGGDRVVSFIIPALNAERTIGRCLESIRGQDYPADSIEIVVVDNGSRDDTVAIAKRATPHVIIDTSATIAGLRNRGAGSAKGDILVFADSDCVIASDWLRRALNHCGDDTVGLVGSKAYQLPDGAGWIDATWKMHLGRGRGIEDADWVGSIIMLVKREVFDAVGGFDASLSTCEDVDFCYRVKRGYRILSDDRLAPVHLGTIKSLSAFFRKESWRGQDNLRVTLRYIRTPAEWMGLLWLVYYGSLSALLVAAAAAVFIVKDARYLLIVIAGLVMPVLAVSFDTCRKTGKFVYFDKLVILYFAYTFARIKAMSGWKRR